MVETALLFGPCHSRRARPAVTGTINPFYGLFIIRLSVCQVLHSRVGSWPYPQTRLERLARGKRSGLWWKVVTYGCKEFYNVGHSWGRYCKAFLGVICICVWHLLTFLSYYYGVVFTIGSQFVKFSTSSNIKIMYLGGHLTPSSYVASLLRPS